jgi:hypothetical protein
MTLSFEDLQRLISGRCGTFDVACPMCGPSRRAAPNKVRKVLRVWIEEDFATYNCQRCLAKGWARRDGAARIDPAERDQRRAVVREQEDRQKLRRQLLASHLWSRSLPIAGTIAATYLRSRKITCPLPATLRFLPARGGHPPAMIGAFGIPAEPEPGVLAIATSDVMGVHLTKLEPGGSGKAKMEPNKITIGKFVGSPIVVAPMNDALVLAITEGIEDALSIHQALGLGAWAAGSAGRLPALAEAIASTPAEHVTIVADNDPAGIGGATRLRDRLGNLGIAAEIKVL